MSEVSHPSHVRDITGFTCQRYHIIHMSVISHPSHVRDITGFTCQRYHIIHMSVISHPSHVSDITSFTCQRYHIHQMSEISHPSLGMGDITGISVYCDSVKKQFVPRYVFATPVYRHFPETIVYFR